MFYEAVIPNIYQARRVTRTRFWNRRHRCEKHLFGRAEWIVKANEKMLPMDVCRWSRRDEQCCSPCDDEHVRALKLRENAVDLALISDDLRELGSLFRFTAEGLQHVGLIDCY